MNTILRYTLIILTSVLTLTVGAQSVNPTATYTDTDGETVTLASGESYSGSAPLMLHLSANKTDADNMTAYFEWRVYSEANNTSPLYVRYEENTDFTFNESGSFRIYLIARFTDAFGQTIEWNEEDNSPITVSISESELIMPNAFSPNGDGINDIYKPKSGFKSITEFRGYIFNRWGVKLFEWSDPSTGWDGTYKGKDVADGVYFCLIKAKGADGRTFNIKKDVNLLRGYTEGTTINP